MENTTATLEKIKVWLVGQSLITSVPASLN